MDGEVLGIVTFGLIGLLWLLLPFFENDRVARSRQWITGLSVFALVFVITMSVYGYLAK